jgi:hypothetical protein
VSVIVQLGACHEKELFQGYKTLKQSDIEQMRLSMYRNLSAPSILLSHSQHDLERPSPITISDTNRAFCEDSHSNHDTLTQSAHQPSVSSRIKDVSALHKVPGASDLPQQPDQIYKLSNLNVLRVFD